ncbi:MAG: SDR family NAD(P)-dependent oxidoreductase [Actinobacteria bacterium]|nr:SDR family NAD(P)-dependent oxidoreductase [Actinomycetota bacterium]
MPDLVFVTGASRGLGLAIAEAVPFPARVVDVSRTGPPEDSGIDHLPADLSDPASWRKVAHGMQEITDDADPQRLILIHAAGTLSPMGFAGEVDLDAYTHNVLLNSAAGQVLGHAFLAVAAPRPGERVMVMISSGAASSVYPGWTAYGAGKAALDQWVRNAGEEQRRRGAVVVAAIAPGVIDTSMQEEIRSTPAEDFPDVDRFRRLHEEGDLIAPEVAARRFWEALEDGLTPGSVIDLRHR